MDLLSLLTHALGGGQQHQPAPRQTSYTPQQQSQMTPVGQPIPQDKLGAMSPQTRALADIYNQNPQDQRVAGIDPAQFGYAPDSAPAPQITPGRNPNQDYNPLQPMSGATRGLAQIYSANPNDPRVRNTDPRSFGYGPDNGQKSPSPQTFLDNLVHLFSK